MVGIDPQNFHRPPRSVFCTLSDDQNCSFISLTKVLAAPLTLVSPGCYLVALIKPQFEAKKNEVERGGIVRNQDVHLQVCAKIEQWISERPGWNILGIEESPITGANGNKEFFIVGNVSC